MKKQIALILVLTMLCTLVCPAAFAATQENPNGDVTEVSEETPVEPEKTPTVSEETPAEPEKTPTVSEETPAEPEKTPTVSEETPAEPEKTPAVSEETPVVSDISKEDFLARCQELAELAEKGKKKRALALYDILKDELKEWISQISLSKALDEEVSAAAVADYESCRESFLLIAHALTEGELREKLKNHISDEEFDYLEQFTLMTEKGREEMTADGSAAEEYLTILSDAAKKASATLNGKTYTYEQLQEDIPEGLTEEEWSDLLEQCRSQIADSCADAFIQLITMRREIAKEMGAASYDQLLDAEKGCKATPEEMKTFYQTVKEFASDPRFSGSIIRGQNQDITIEEFLDAFTAVVEEASPLAAEALEYLKDTDGIVIKKAESESDSEESAITYLDSDFQQALLNLNLNTTNAGFQTLARLLGAFTGIYASDATDSFWISGPNESRIAVCGACLSALLTGYYDSVLNDADAAILANNTVTRLKNQLRRFCMINEWEQYLYSDAPLTKEGLVEEYNSLREAYGMKGTGYDGMLNTRIIQSPRSMQTKPLESFYALQVFNEVMKDPDNATEMFEEFCENMMDDDCEEVLTDAGFVYFADEDGVRETLQEAAENYQILHKYASVASEETPAETEKTPTEAEKTPTESEKNCAECEKDCTECEKDCTECEKDCAECEKDCAECEKDCAECEKDCAECEKDCAECEKDCAECEKDCAECEKDCAECEKDCAECEKDRAECEKDRAECEKDRAECEKDCAECERNCVEAKETSAESKKTLAESKETSAEPKKTLAESQETPSESEETPVASGISKEDFLARCQELAEQAENGEAKQVLAIYDSLKEGLKELEDQISHIQAQGGEISDEVSSDCAACREAFLDVAYALTQGKLREKLKDHISEEEFAYLEQFPPMSEERRAKMLAVDSALEEYETTLNDAVKNASATLKGKTYTYEQLQEGLPEGLTEEEQSELLEQFRSQVIDSCADVFIQVITARRELAKEVGVTSYDQLLYAIHDRKVSQEDLQTFYQIVKECISDPQFSGTGIPERNQDFTTEEFLDEFTAIVEEASPLASEALEYLKDTDSIVIENAETASGLSSVTYFDSGDQQALLNLKLGNTNASFQTFARLLGAFTGVYASAETDSFCVSGLDEDRTQVCGVCLSALLTGYYDSVLSDTDAAILANNTVTRLKNELKIYCMMSEMEQYLYSDAPLTKEGLIDKYNSICESYGMEGSNYLSMFSYEIMQPLSSDNKTMRAGAPSAFYALQVFNKVMKNPDKATEMFEELCTSMNDEEALKEVGFVYFTDADGVRETLQEAAENYEVLHGYASMMSALRDNGVELELDGDLSEILQIMKQVKPLIEQLPELLTKLQEAA